MSPEDFAKKLRSQIKEIRKGKPMFLALNTAISEMGERIFEDGKSTRGRTFKYNSTNEIWVNGANYQRGKIRKGSGRGKKGTPTRGGSTYYKSYKEFRAKQGRNSSKVNWRLSGALQKDFLNSVKRPRATKINNFKYVTAVSNESKKIIDGQESKYGVDIFKMNTDEFQTLQKAFTFEILKILQS